MKIGFMSREKTLKAWLLAISIIAGILLAACEQPLPETKQSNLEEILSAFHDPLGGKVLIAAHRSMHTLYPENSLAAIQHAIDSGFVDSGYMPLLSGGATVIQTDRPLLVLQFLINKKRG